MPSGPNWVSQAFTSQAGCEKYSASSSAEAVGPDRVAGLSRSAQWLAESRGYEWVRAIRLDLVTVDGRRVRYFADAFHP